MTDLFVLRGAIEDYQVERKIGNFIWSGTERGALGATAIAAAVSGASGLAMGATIAATSTDEEADYVQFEVEGKLVKGWLWRSPFSEGDVVDVVVSKSDDQLGLVAVHRLNDGVIALYPHVSRGSWAHAINAFKWWAIGCSTVFGLFSILFAYMAAESGSLWDQFGNKNFLQVIFGSGAMFSGWLLIYTIWSLGKWKKYTKLAEKIFVSLGWKGEKKIDLIKSSKRLRRGDESFDYGSFFFRRQE